MRKYKFLLPFLAAAIMGLSSCNSDNEIVGSSAKGNNFAAEAGDELATLTKSNNTGAVYTMTNDASGNEVVVFDRAADGTLTLSNTYSTGGSGSGGGLGNQGGVVLSSNNRWLFAVNAGSNDISVFAVQSHGLNLSDRVPSGGERPVSVTVHRRFVYVLNAGNPDDGNITGFFLTSHGKLKQIPNSTQPLSSSGVTDPAQVGFSPNGGLLVVTEKATNTLSTYLLGNNGLVSGPNSQPSVGVTPFGFSFNRRGVLAVSEAFGGMANQSAASSYRAGDDANGILHPISESVGSTQTAACWLVITKNGRFAYVTNTGSGSISSYRIGNNGSLSLLDAVAGTGTNPLDAALSNNSRFLYTLNNGAGTISAFQVNSNGSLTFVAETGAVLTPGVTNGLAAR